VGWFHGSAIDRGRVSASIETHWWTLKVDGQERWSYLFDEGLFDAATANGIADAVVAEWAGVGMTITLADDSGSWRLSSAGEAVRRDSRPVTADKESGPTLSPPARTLVTCR
jgi:hypothetical protein